MFYDAWLVTRKHTVIAMRELLKGDLVVFQSRDLWSEKKCMEIYNGRKEQTIYTPPVQTITVGKDYHSQVIATLTGHRLVLEAALDALTTCADTLTEVA